MTVKYIAEWGWRPRVYEVEIEKETPHTVTVISRLGFKNLMRKESNGRKVCDTREDAIARVRKELNGELELHRTAVKSALKQIEEFERKCHE